MKKTIVFDVDDTLCDSAWARLNTAAGVTAEKDYELYLKFSREEFDYESWTQQLADIYRQKNILTESLAREVLTSYTLKEGAEVVIKTLKQRGYEVILITGGF